MDTYIASKAIPWAQPSNRTRQDRCGFITSIWSDPSQFTNGLGWGSRHTQTHSLIVRQAETQSVTRRHAGRWLLPHTARPARDTAVQASGSGTNKQAPGPGRLSFYFKTNANTQKRPIRLAGRHGRQEQTWSPIPPWPFTQQTNWSINRQAGSSITRTVIHRDDRR